MKKSIFRKMINVKCPILITGPSGTGKSQMARKIYDHSFINKDQFLTLHLASLKEDLIESELFGHRKGSFTGAIENKNTRAVPLDYKKAFEWYRKAAEQNNVQAQYMLGVKYANGEGVEQDYGKSVEWYLKAAKRGHSAAQHQLGIFYKAGHAVQQDDTQALKWFRKSAEQGFAAGQFAYGGSVFTGKGTPENKLEGYKWIYLAAMQDYDVAKSTLPKIERLMSKQEISQAQESAKSFEPIEVTEATEDNTRNADGSLPPKATGTGFFITENGFLITNRHVVGGCKVSSVIGFFAT